MSEVNIDDVDAAVTYSGDWQSSTDLRSYQNTIHFTNSLNSQAKLTFIGISVTAYGVVRASETPQSSYTLDGGDPTFLQSTSKVISQYGVLLYKSPVLSNGQHNLVIKNLGNGSTFFLDYFVVTSASSTGSSTSTTIISPLISITPATTSGASGSKTSPSSSSNSNSGASSLRISESGSPSSVGGAILPASTTSVGNSTNTNSVTGGTGKSTHNIAAIIGGVSALAVVICFIIIYFYLRRRQRKKKEFESWIINSFSGYPILPVVRPQMNEDLSQLPPRYAASEPPAYDPLVRPEFQVSDSQPITRGVDFRMVEKSSGIKTQSSANDSPTLSSNRNNESS